MSTDTASPLLCFVDTETGGLRTNDRPWEIAVVRRDSEDVETRHVVYIADFAPSKADPKALELGGFYDRHPLHTVDPLARAANSPAFDPESPSVDERLMTEGQAAYYLERLVRGATVVCCNPGYDVPRLTAMLERHGFAWTAHYRDLCATTYAAGLLGMLPPFDNRKVGAALGISRNAHGTEHTGLADALYARDLYDAAVAADSYLRPAL